MEFEAVKLVEVVVRGVRKLRKSHPYIPRAWRWAKVIQAGNKSFTNVNDEDKEFTFRPYAHTPQGTSILCLFDLHNQEVMLSHRYALTSLVMMMREVVGSTLLPYKTESDEDVDLYSPRGS